MKFKQLKATVDIPELKERVKRYLKCQFRAPRKKPRVIRKLFMKGEKGLKRKTHNSIEIPGFG